jgi:cytidylate kinase
VREALYDRQRVFATQPGGAVLDGRDIGTVIVPEADAKLFVTASIGARAQRRFVEMQIQGRTVRLEDIAADLAARDERDRNRKEAPLRQADDALLLDNSGLSPQASIERAIALVEGRIR